MNKIAFEIKDLSKIYQMGQAKVMALREVSLEVPEGDYLAIVGPSGSGKSTLLNVLGCLDRQSSGHYRLSDKQVEKLDDHELSALRGKSIGFIFQSYNLIPYLNVIENIILPASYRKDSGVGIDLAKKLAKMVGLSDRMGHRPMQLSGGQQQRVGIARSLVNDPSFILADEPTGNLDSATASEILDLLEDLNRKGKTIVLVTHEEEVANRASRIVRMKDGRIIGDDRIREPVHPANEGCDPTQASLAWPAHFIRSAKNVIGTSLQSVVTHPLRSLLTGLGVFIGVVSVVWLLAIGEGIAAQAEGEIMKLGANNLIIASKRPPEEERSSKGNYFYSYGLTENDFLKISKVVPHISAAYPTRELDRRMVSTKDGSKRAELLGCLPNYRELHDLRVTKGRFISEEDNFAEAEVCVLSTSLAKILFPFGDSLGKSINIGGNLYVVIGEVAPRANLTDGADLGFKELFEDNVYLPLGTHWAKVFDYYYRGYDGSHLISKLTLTIDDQSKLLTVGQMIRDLLAKDHGIEDYQVTIPLELMQQAERAKLTFVALMGLVAGISLFVGGVGIMNIMLATVTERTKEIGIRRAIGAKRKDVVAQFLCETVALSGLGGGVGIFAGLLCEPAYKMVLKYLQSLSPGLYESLPVSMQNMSPVVVPWSLPLVFMVAVATGMIFGIYPARKAAQMDPVEALRHSN